jgi:hypothetical protein
MVVTTTIVGRARDAVGVDGPLRVRTCNSS